MGPFAKPSTHRRVGSHVSLSLFLSLPASCLHLYVCTCFKLYLCLLMNVLYKLCVNILSLRCFANRMYELCCEEHVVHLCDCRCNPHGRLETHVFNFRDQSPNLSSTGSHDEPI